MVNESFEGQAHEYWSQKNYWSVEDVLNIHWGGLENASPVDYDEIQKMRNDINQAVANGQLKTTQTPDGSLFKRDDIVKWASQNLEEFPFILEDFETVKKRKHPGSSREDTQLRIIGALALLLSKQTHAYTIGDRPNKHAIAKAVGEHLDHLQAENPNLKGLKISNLRNFISQGIELLTE